MAEPNRQSGENEERIIEIEIERLRPFKEHPFQVKDDKEMFLLQESIEKYGILNPLIVRPVPDPFKNHPFKVLDDEKMQDQKMQDLVESVKINGVLTPVLLAVDISYIDKEVQEWIYEYITDTGFIKPKQIAALRNQLNDGPINQIQMLSIFNNCVMAKKVSRSLTFSEKKLTKHFPDDYTAKDMEQVIESLLEKWMQEQSC